MPHGFRLAIVPFLKKYKFVFADDTPKCEYMGQKYNVGEKFQPDPKYLPCKVCECLNAPRDIICNTLSCDPLECLEGEEEVRLPGECCPICQRKSFYKNKFLLELKHCFLQ